MLIKLIGLPFGEKTMTIC